MSIVRFNPWRDLDRVEARHWAPPVDIWETPEAFRIEMDLPAVDPADVDVSIARWACSSGSYASP